MDQQQDILREIGAATSPTELWDVVLDFFTSHGIDKVSYHGAAVADHPSGIATHGFPSDWVCEYISDNLVKVDPIPTLAQLHSEPFLWSEARQKAKLTPENHAYLEKLAESDVGDGLAMSVFGPRMRNAYVGLGFGDKSNRPNGEQIQEFQMVAQMAHLKYCELCEHDQKDTPALSPREKQALEWAARGKSNGVIAQIMEISPHTVDTLMRRTYEKLGVTDRTSAAIKALGSGLLQYHDCDVA